MSRIIAIFLLSLPITLNAEEVSIPKTFVNGEIADATDFNTNNNYLIDKIVETKADIANIVANARWANADLKGAIVKKIDCSANQSALIEAYHAHVHEDHVIFLLTGSCFGAYRFIEEVGENDEVFISQVQPKNQVVGLISDRTVNPSNRAKLIPRKLVADREYFLAGLVSSFGNGLYINDIDIEMGADDTWGVLFSRSSNGDLTNVSIKGDEENGNPYGVLIQNGASAYVGGNDENALIEDVNEGIKLRNESMANIYGTLKIKGNTGISTFSGGTFQLSLSGDGKITAPTALNIGYGGQGWVNNSNTSVSIDGDIEIGSSTVMIGGNTIFSASTSITLYNSNLSIFNENSGIEAGMLECHGVSVVNITGLSLANNGGNKCLDNNSWRTLIESAFPSSSSSSMQKSKMARRESNSNAAELPKQLVTPPPAGWVDDGQLPW